MEVTETRYAKSGDVSIAYQVVGDGPFDVVLVPAISHIELMWSMANYQGEIPRRLASFARLIVFDRRGGWACPTASWGSHWRRAWTTSAQ